MTEPHSQTFLPQQPGDHTVVLPSSPYPPHPFWFFPEKVIFFFFQVQNEG